MTKRRRSKRRAPVRRVPARVAMAAGGGLALLLAIVLIVGQTSDPAGALDRARAYAEAGDMASARVEAMNAVQVDSGNAEAWELLATSQLALGDGQGARATVERARGAGIPPHATRHLLAEAMLLSGDTEAALEEAGRSDIAPAYAGDAARVRARAFHALGETGPAADAFNAAIEADDENSRLWLDLARFRMDTGALRAAIEAADRAVELDDRNLSALVLRGRLVRSQYGLVASLEWFERALAINPEYMPALFEYAKTLGEIGRHAEMLAATREMLALDPDNADAYFLQAVLAARARNFGLARRIVERIDGQLDHLAAMQLLNAAIAYQERNYEMAIRDLERLLGYQPANRNALRLLGAAQFRSGDMDGVIQSLRPLADRGDADSYMLTLVGRALENRGEFAAAIPYLRRAAEPETALAPLGPPPEDASALAVIEREARSGGAPAQVSLIRAYLSLGRLDEAMERASRLAADNPDAPDAYILLGDVLGAQGDFRGAAVAYANAANIRFSEGVALRMIEALLRAGEQQEALRTLALYRQQNPRATTTARLSAQYNLGAGNWRQAAAILEQLRRRVGDRDAVILANLAWARHELGEDEQAGALARRAYLLLPGNAATSEIYGWVLFDSGANRTRGLRLLEKAGELAPGNPRIQWRLARAYAALGRSGPARRAVDAALASPAFDAREEAQALRARL